MTGTQASAAKRFYDAVEVVPGDDGFAVALDGRMVKTPGGATLSLPARPLAEAVGEEWDAQTGAINPAAMPLTGLANAAIDRVAAEPDTFVEQVVAYAGTDMVCYWATEPASLVERQRATWQPLLDWAADALGARLRLSTGIVPVEQPADAIESVRRAVAASDPFRLAGLVHLTGVAGSAVIALTVAEGRLDTETAFTAAFLDELHQAEQWGEEQDAARRRAALRADLEAGARFLALLRDKG